MAKQRERWVYRVAQVHLERRVLRAKVEARQVPADRPLATVDRAVAPPAQLHPARAPVDQAVQALARAAAETNLSVGIRRSEGEASASPFLWRLQS